MNEIHMITPHRAGVPLLCLVSTQSVAEETSGSLNKYVGSTVPPLPLLCMSKETTRSTNSPHTTTAVKEGKKRINDGSVGTVQCVRFWKEGERAVYN